MSVVEVGSYVVTSQGVAQVTRVGRLDRADGAWIVSPTGDPGSRTSYPVFAPDWCLRPAVVGTTVCPTPRGGCYCGMRHVSAELLAELPRETA